MMLGDRNHDDEKGLVFSLSSLFKDQLVQRQVQNSLPEAGILAFEILETLRLVELQTAILAPPSLIALFRDPKRSTDPSDRLAPAQPNLSLPKQGDDLFRRISLPCHILVSSSEFGNSRIRSVNVVPFRGAGHEKR